MPERVTAHFYPLHASLSGLGAARKYQKPKLIFVAQTC